MLLVLGRRVRGAADFSLTVPAFCLLLSYELLALATYGAKSSQLDFAVKSRIGDLKFLAKIIDAINISVHILLLRT